jgi:hypothetical protein
MGYVVGLAAGRVVMCLHHSIRDWGATCHLEHLAADGEMCRLGQQKHEARACQCQANSSDEDTLCAAEIERHRRQRRATEDCQKHSNEPETEQQHGR